MPPSEPPARRWINRLGLGLQLAAVVFLVVVAQRNFEAIAAIDAEPWALALTILGVTLLSMLVLALLALGWRALLRGAGATATFKKTLWVQARTSIAKYLPGNVLHYVGRQFHAQALGANQATLLATSVAEVVCVVSASCLIALAVAPFMDTGALPVDKRLVAAGGLLGMLSPFGLVLAKPLIRRLGANLGLGPAAWLKAYGAYLAALLAGLASFLLPVLILAPGVTPAQLTALGGAYVFSYLVGFVTPGVPGGLGLREALLVMLGGALVGAPVVLSAAILQRAGSIAGEAVWFGLSYLRGRWT